MFKHILFPTDGSSMSDMAREKCFALAKEMGAQVTALYVIPEFHVIAYAPELVTDTPERYQQESEAYARNLLSKVGAAADQAGVACNTLFLSNDDPYEAIIQTATERGCDLICMASHGRKGFKGLLLGSETQKVLTHTTTPVLVYR